MAQDWQDIPPEACGRMVFNVESLIRRMHQNSWLVAEIQIQMLMQMLVLTLMLMCTELHWRCVWMMHANIYDVSKSKDATLDMQAEKLIPSHAEQAMLMQCCIVEDAMLSMLSSHTMSTRYWGCHVEQTKLRDRFWGHTMPGDVNAEVNVMTMLMQCNAIWYNAIRWNTMLCNTMQCGTISCWACNVKNTLLDLQCNGRHAEWAYCEVHAILRMTHWASES